jgi:hypothetical protein
MMIGLEVVNAGMVPNEIVVTMYSPAVGEPLWTSCNDAEPPTVTCIFYDNPNVVRCWFNSDAIATID